MHEKMKQNNARFRIRKLFYIIVNGINFRNRCDYNRAYPITSKTKIGQPFPWFF